MPEEKVNVIKIYNGQRDKWAIGRFPGPGGAPGVYRIGTFVKGGISFQNKDFTSQEDAEGWLVYQVDTSVTL
jgi:hypothetical protein